MKPYRGPSVRAGANAAVGADEEKFFAVCRRRKVRRISRSSTSTSDGHGRSPPVFFSRFMRQASFGSPRVSFETIQNLFIRVYSFVFLLDSGMSGEVNPRSHDRPSSSSSRDGQLSKSAPHPQVEKVQSEKVDEKKGNSFSAVLTRGKKEKEKPTWRLRRPSGKCHSRR